MIRSISLIITVVLFCIVSTHSFAQLAGLSHNSQATNINVDQSSGAAVLPIKLDVPPGRAGIEPNIQLVYNSNAKGLGLAGVGWNMDLGSIMVSTKKGVPKYDSTDTYTLNGVNLIYDPSVGYYRMETEGAFNKIEKLSTGWQITDKKGTKYLYGTTTDARLYDPANTARVFKWNLNKVIDVFGSALNIYYRRDQAQVYPDHIYYTSVEGSNASLVLGTPGLVTFEYAPARQPSSFYNAGFKVTNGMVISAIHTGIYPSTPQNSYFFIYEASKATKRDLLKSIKIDGRIANMNLVPQINFTYQETVRGFHQQTDWTIPAGARFAENRGSFDADLGVRAVDLNGDGFTDFIRNYENCSNGYVATAYINNKNKTWTENALWGQMSSMPSFQENCLNRNIDHGMRLADIDGDGLSDVVRSYKRDPNIGGELFRNAQINDIRGYWTGNPGYVLPDDAVFAYQRNYSDYYTEFGGTLMADINGDSYNDIVIAKNNADARHATYLHNKNTNPSVLGWTANALYATPSDVDFNNGWTLVDINGDGLADMINMPAGITKVYMNTGSGWVEDASSPWKIMPVSPDFKTGKVQFIDLNSDGLSDMVYQDSTGTRSMINTGNGWFEDSSAVEGWALNSSVKFENYSTQLVDLDGNGMVDYLVHYNGQTPVVGINKSTPVDTLERVDNGIGGVATIVYKSSASFVKKFMPFSTFVVDNITVTNSGLNSYTTRYAYEGANWDAQTREFRGFEKVTTYDQNNNYSINYYFQDHFRKGMAYKTENYDSTNKLLSKTEQFVGLYEVISPTVQFPYLQRKDDYFYDASGVLKQRSAELFVYDFATGAVTMKKKWGAIDLSTYTLPVMMFVNPSTTPEYYTSPDKYDPTKVTALDNNIVRTDITYVAKTGFAFMQLPGVIWLRDNANATLQKTLFYYDNASSNTAAFSNGLLTKKEEWTSDTTAALSTTYAYDALGNLTSTTDPKGNATTIVYDARFRMFPVQTVNALGQTVKTYYYGINDDELYADPKFSPELRGMFGQVMAVVDANNQKVFKHHDTLGRLSKVQGPLDSLDFPATEVIYENFATYQKVTTKSRISPMQAGTIDTVQYIDGLGRLIQTKKNAAATGQYIVSDQKMYDARGLIQRAFPPRFTTNDLNTLDALPAISAPHTLFSYDALRRPVTVNNADGTYTTTIYDVSTTTTIDENGHKNVAVYDSFGRMVKREEYTGSDGRHASYPAAAFALYATTQYQYDVKGNLTKVIDAKGNTTTMTYDNLGRKITMNDVDMHNWTYNYDANGNLISQGDANAKTLNFTYDKLNRLTLKSEVLSGQTPTTSNIHSTYTYDAANHGISTGRLTTASSIAGPVADFTYDQLGRETTTVKKINGINYTVNRQYDALNRLKQVQYPDNSSVTYLYDRAGQVTAVADSNAVINGALAALPSGANDTAQPALMQELLGLSNAYAQTAPTYSLTSPANNSTFTIPSTMTMSTNVPSGYRVGYYLGSIYLGESTTAPYTLNWNTSSAGTFALKAKLTHMTTGAVTYTASINVTINPHKEPVTSITYPTNGSTIAAGSNVTMSASATVTGGYITKVDFYRNGVFVGVDTTSPYTMPWNNVTSGLHSIAVNATDSYGWTTSSKEVYVTVASASTIPTVSLTAPANNSTYSAGANITLNASAAVSSGSITKVEFFSGSTLMGTDYSSPFSYTWSAASAGTYALTAKATTSANTTQTSSVVNITVNSTVASPTISLTSPSNNASFAAPANITLSASATSPGTITKVEFYNGATLLNTDTASPYAYTWSNVAAGSYNVSAKVYDSNNNTAVSSAAVVTVNTAVAAQYIKRIDYNANGQMTQVLFGNGASTAYTYDGLNFRLKRIYTSNAQAQKLQDLNYTYDGVGNILAITDTANTATQTFKYDDLNRLIQAVGSYGTKNYAYDQIGNLTLKDGLSYTYGGYGAGPHAVTSTSDGTTYRYDANGNMTTKQTTLGVWTYVYDTENRLKSIGYAPSGKIAKTIANYYYDGDGGRTQKVVYRYSDTSYNNQDTYGLLLTQIGAPYIPAGNTYTTSSTVYVGSLYEMEDSRTTKYVFIGSTRVAAVTGSEVDYYHSDHLGSANVISDSLGAARSLTEYDPFGKVSRFERYGSKINTGWHGFNNKPLDDESGLLFYGGRYYDPKLGRFLTADTLVPRPTNPQELNRYSYVLNNPINRVDPSGHKSFWKKFSGFFGAIIGAVVGIVAGPAAGIATYSAIAASGQSGNFALNLGMNAVSALGLVSGNPFLITSSVLAIASSSTAQIGGATALGISKGLGYAAMAFAAVGVMQQIGQAVTNASNAAKNVEIVRGLGLSTEPYYTPMAGTSSEQLMGILSGIKESPGAVVAAGQKVVAVANSTGKSISRAITYFNDSAIPNLSNSWGDKAYNLLASVDWRQVQAYSSLVVGGAAMATLTPAGISWGVSTVGFAVADLTSIYGKFGPTASEIFATGVDKLKWGNIVESAGKISLSADPTYLFDKFTRALGDALNSASAH